MKPTDLLKWRRLAERWDNGQQEARAVIRSMLELADLFPVVLNALNGALARCEPDANTLMNALEAMWPGWVLGPTDCAGYPDSQRWLLHWPDCPGEDLAVYGHTPLEALEKALDKMMPGGWERKQPIPREALEKPEEIGRCFNCTAQLRGPYTAVHGHGFCSEACIESFRDQVARSRRSS
ncbi:MAG: hypothetical protein ACPGQD_03700 [Planctomycetota bacterium]